MDTITIVNPVRQHRLEVYIKATQKAIDYNLHSIIWAKHEITWSEQYDFDWAKEYGQWVKEELVAYEEELRKVEAHLEDLQNRLKEEREKPL